MFNSSFSSKTTYAVLDFWKEPTGYRWFSSKGPVKPKAFPWGPVKPKAFQYYDYTWRFLIIEYKTNKANLRNLVAAAGPVTLFDLCNVEIEWMTLKNNHLQMLKLDPNHKFSGLYDLLIRQMTLKKGHLSHTSISHVCHFIANCQFKVI